MMTDTNVRIVDVAADGDGGLTIGGKAAGLAKLARAGLPVPRAVAVPAEALDIDIDDLAAEIADRFPESRLAIRSSGVAEDLEQASSPVSTRRFSTSSPYPTTLRRRSGTFDHQRPVRVSLRTPGVMPQAWPCS